jgi:hypothetical protein
MTDWATINFHFPYRGPCGICGGPDARHRLFDCMRGRVRAGDTPESVAEDYGCTLAALRAVLEPKRCPTRRKKP